jgi:hypothetical protein
VPARAKSNRAVGSRSLRLRSRCAKFLAPPTNGPKEFGRFHSVARSGQESIAQGLPWVIHPTQLALKGPPGAARIGSEPLNRVACSSSCPLRAKRLFRLTQGKPWAKLSCPFGAGPSGRRTGANTYKPWAELSCPSGRVRHIYYTTACRGGCVGS